MRNAQRAFSPGLLVGWETCVGSPTEHRALCGDAPVRIQDSDDRLAGVVGCYAATEVF